MTAKKSTKATKAIKAAKTAKPNVRAAVYDFTRGVNPAGGRKRRAPQIERKPEEDILGIHHRREGIDLARDMVRNSPLQRGLMRTLRVNVVGDFGKLRFNADGEWFAAAQKYFNGTWSRHADFRDGSSWRETLQLAVCALENEGDFVVLFDDGFLTGGLGSGRIRIFEADQIADLDEAGFAEFAARGWSQHDGVILDEYGRKTGIIVTGSKRGESKIKREDALVLLCDPADPDAAPWRHVLRKFRLAQLRGVPPSFASLQTVIDGYEALGYELQTAKVAASKYAAIISQPTADTGAPVALDDVVPGEEDPEEEAAAVDIDAAADRAEGLEIFTGGNMDYLDAGQQIVFDPANRPNTNLPTFLDYTGDLSGLAYGLNHAYARGRADTSYTAFRGDMVMTWMAFRDSQQFLEDSFADWVAESVLRHAIATGRLPAPPSEDWADSIAWQYPTMPAVDEGKEAAATVARLQSGLTTYRDELGPDWHAKLAQRKAELAEFPQFATPTIMPGATAAGAKEEEA